MNSKFQKPAKKESRKETSSKASSSKKKSRDGDEDGSKKKKQKKKKDPNAPKRAMSGFMFFSQMEREVSCVFYIYGTDHMAFDGIVQFQDKNEISWQGQVGCVGLERRYF
jgi:hypothetical protein